MFNPVFSQNDRHFGDSFCNPEEKPVLVFNGERVLIHCDTAFFVNKHRMALYEIAREMIMNSNTQNVTRLIKAYDNTLLTVSNSYDSLLFNYRQLDELFRQTVQDNQNSLNAMKSDLDKANTALQNSRKLLEEAQEKLDKKDTSSLKRKAIYAGGGLLAGILLMLIIN